MFFSISLNRKENFSEFFRLGNFDVNTDAGWQIHQQGSKTAVYKGYADQGTLLSLLDQILIQTEPKLTGNFCAIVYDSNTGTVEIKTDRYRGFPIFVDANNEVTNLTPYPQVVWSNRHVSVNYDCTVNETKFNLVGTIDTTELSKDEVVTQIHKILDKRTENFVKYNRLPIRAFLSGGVDSLLVYSYLQKYTDNYELIRCQHIDYDRFWLNNHGTLENNWGYTQIHHWSEPCILTSGTPGDEFMLRGPITCHEYLKFHGISMMDLLKNPLWENCLHYSYYHKPENLETFNRETDTVADSRLLQWALCNNVANDWQHWHLGNTLTWTPLRDLEIFKLILRLPIDDAVAQIMNSDLSRTLIEQNSPGLTKVISDQKNFGNYMKNLCDFLL